MQDLGFAFVKAQGKHLRDDNLTWRDLTDQNGCGRHDGNDTGESDGISKQSSHHHG